jgi:hypothetical protein
MKKILVFTLSVVLIAVVVAMITLPSHAVSQSKSSAPAMTSSIPDSVAKILEKSCYPCHSEPGNGMAMMHLNFDKWGTYNADKQADKAGDICKKVTKESMPPKSFRKDNPDKVPTAAEVKILCDWANSLSKK